MQLTLSQLQQNPNIIPPSLKQLITNGIIMQNLSIPQVSIHIQSLDYTETKIIGLSTIMECLVDKNCKTLPDFFKNLTAQTIRAIIDIEKKIPKIPPPPPPVEEYISRGMRGGGGIRQMHKEEENHADNLPELPEMELSGLLDTNKEWKINPNITSMLKPITLDIVTQMIMDISQRIKEQIRTYLSRLENPDIDYSSSSDSNTIISAYISAYQEHQALFNFLTTVQKNPLPEFNNNEILPTYEVLIPTENLDIEHLNPQNFYQEDLELIATCANTSSEQLNARLSQPCQNNLSQIFYNKVNSLGSELETLKTTYGQQRKSDLIDKEAMLNKNLSKIMELFSMIISLQHIIYVQTKNNLDLIQLLHSFNHLTSFVADKAHIKSVDDSKLLLQNNLSVVFMKPMSSYGSIDKDDITYRNMGLSNMTLLAGRLARVDLRAKLNLLVSYLSIDTENKKHGINQILDIIQKAICSSNLSRDNKLKILNYIKSTLFQFYKQQPLYNVIQYAYLLEWGLKDIEGAKKIYEQAIQYGSKKSSLSEEEKTNLSLAKHNLAYILFREANECNNNDIITKQSLYIRAFNLFNEAKRISSYYFIGYMYEHGLGVEQNMKSATDFYTPSAQSMIDNWDITQTLSHIYKNIDGENVKDDDVIAIEALIKKGYIPNADIKDLTLTHQQSLQEVAETFAEDEVNNLTCKAPKFIFPNCLYSLEAQVEELDITQLRAFSQINSSFSPTDKLKNEDVYILSTNLLLQAKLYALTLNNLSDNTQSSTYRGASRAA